MPPLTPVFMEKASGDQMAPVIEKEFGGVSDDARLAQYIAWVGGTRLLPFSDRGDEPHVYKVLNEEKVVNAFALGNGNVYVTKACLKMLDTEAQLAEIMGHENGHFGKRHIAAQMDRAIGTGGLLAVANVVYSFIRGDKLTEKGQEKLAEVNEIVPALIMNGFGREQELEADSHGLRTMKKAGYDPRQSIEVFKKFQKMEPETNALEQFFQSHPTASTRIADLDAQMRKEIPDWQEGGEVGRERYQAIVNGKMNLHQALAAYPWTGKTGPQAPASAYTWLYVAGGFIVIPSAVYAIVKAMQ